MSTRASTGAPLQGVRDRFTLPLATRRALVESGRVDLDRYRTELLAYIREADPQFRAFADFRPADLERSDVPAACTITYKDTIDVAGYPTRLGIRSGFRHYPHRSAEIARRLTARGLCCVGKVAVTECALGTERPSLNPVYPELSASGSSTGSAVAVAAGFCDVSVGTDSAGSIRWPAVYCGATSLRLTPRPRWLAGVHTVAPSLESVGLVTRSAADLGWLWRTYHLGALLAAEPLRAPNVLRIGVSLPPDEPLHPEVATALDRLALRLARWGHQLTDIDLDAAWRERAAAWELLSREAFDGFGCLLGRVDLPLAPDTQQVIRGGGRVPDDRYAELLATQRRAVDRMGRLLSRRIDLLLVPLETGLPDRADRRHAVTVPTTASTPTDLSLTVLASFARLPVVALPVGLSSDGAPIGVQIIARRGGEELLVAAAELIAELSRSELGRTETARDQLAHTGIAATEIAPTQISPTQISPTQISREAS